MKKIACFAFLALLAELIAPGAARGSGGPTGPVTQDESGLIRTPAVASDLSALLTMVDGIQLLGITPEALVTDPTLTLSDPGVKLVDDDRAQCPKAQYTSIQAAVSAANSGDTIKVCPGHYFEHVDISRPLRLIGDLANPSSTIIDGGSSTEADDHVAIHDTSGVDLGGFKIIRSHSNDAYIGLQRTTDNKVHHNLVMITAADCGPTLCFEPVGVFLFIGSKRNEIYRNTVIGDSTVGLPAGPSERGIMTHCDADETSDPSVACNDNRIHDNSVTGVFNGIQLTNSTHGTVVDHNDSSGNARGFRQFSDDPTTMPTDSSTVRHNKLDNNTERGIDVSISTGNTIHHNESSGNGIGGAFDGGIRLGLGAGGNLINENVAESNSPDGIRAESGSSSNTIQNNKMRLNGTFDARDNTGANTWQNNFCNTSSPSGLCAHANP